VIERVRETIREQRLFQPGETTVVAVSGGVDSVVLLDVLLKLRDRDNVPGEIVVAHLDHGLRGRESEQDLLFVETLCRERRITCYTRRADVAGYAKERGLSIQVAAREVRYAFLGDVARWTGARTVTTAHHADDQAETVLMRILRGTSTKGLGGIPYRRPGPRFDLVRPLLDVWRHEIEAYARAEHLACREDSSNASTKYLRNKIRIHLLPHLMADYNPGVKTALVQLAKLAREDEAYLAELAAAEFRRVVEQAGPGRVSVEVASLAVMPLPLQRRVITLILYYLCGHTKQWEHAHVESVRSLLDSRDPGAELSLPEGLAAWREYDRLYVGTKQSHTPLTDSPLEPLDITAPGALILPESSIHLTWTVVDGVPERPKDAYEAHFDADDLSGSRIYIRTWTTGDSLRPLGMSGRKLVSDILGEAKVPKHRRARWPLLCIGDEIAWVIGIRRGQQALVTPRTARTLVIRATELS
jgi:tRNA(Ile)-lysidine synthase